MVFLHRQNNISKKVRNFGVEIDLRRNKQGLVLNHDLLESNIKYPLFTEKLEFFKNIPIICNIKESNLEELVIEIFDNHGKMMTGGGGKVAHCGLVNSTLSYSYRFKILVFIRQSLFLYLIIFLCL
ncbi:hypothetical protein [Campylobacter jejuni]|uniref:hypothetical protein n=1 Tax=Campylobacter jejuni TaxID=197 RepID=UPI00207BE94C|nr:hypothetical protein [Campylobacter jejuni]